MASLIDRDVLLKEYDKLPVQKVDWVNCGDAYRTRPLVDLARVHNMIEDAPSITEAEIRAKAIEEFAERLKENVNNKYRHFLEIDTDGFTWLTTDAVETHIDETVKELKGE